MLQGGVAPALATNEPARAAKRTKTLIRAPGTLDAAQNPR